VTTSDIQTLKGIEREISQRLLALKSPTTARMRELRREYSKRISLFPPEDVVSLALRLLRIGVPEFFAYELVQYHKQALQSLKAKSLEELGRGINSWVAVDTFACFLSGPVWRERQVSDSLIKRWARSPDRWWRRAAVVSTVPLNNKTRGGSGDAKRTLMICEMLAADRDDMVVKAVSWALRELAKRDHEAVRSFLIKHKDELAPRVLREVNNKLSTGLKNPRIRKANC
jgi:3-methyladenine DNA glycosylase AlkD